MQKPIRILIVDDQPRARKSLKALLSTWSRAGEMQEASNGREAVQLVKDFQPDAVLMDVRMPEVDGLKATVQIKALCPQVKVIVLSMYLEYHDEALAAGADAFVAKGDAPDVLLGILAAIVEEISDARSGLEGLAPHAPISHCRPRGRLHNRSSEACPERCEGKTPMRS